MDGAMLADLERLVRLQQLDDFVTTARRTLAELPEKLAALDERLAGARDQVARAKQRAADNQAARRALDKDLAAVQTRLSRFKDQIMDVKTNREYQAMLKEIETAQHEVRGIEDRILERMLEADEVAAEARSAETTLASEQQSIDTERRQMAEASTRLERQVAEAAPERAAIVAGIPPEVLALFDQVARARRGVAVAEARDGHCAICHVRLRPQKYNDIRRNDAIVQCDSCQRILYFAGGAEENVSA
jgi:predicted  nucleic acid-binding Zn-ribbon protein